MATKPKAAEKPKAPVGRPSGYKPEYCEVAIDLGRQGKSPASIAAYLNVPRETLYDWKEVHPEFSTALRMAKTQEQNYWEEMGQSFIGTPGFNSTVWKVSMAARFRHDYTETKKTEVSGPEGGAIEVKDVTTVDASKLTPEQRDALRAVLLATKG